MANLNILLLGGGGFIGVNLAEKLIADGKHNTTVLDINGEKIKKESTEKFSYVRSDIRKDKAELEELIKKNDVIIDLVAIANPSVYVENPLDVFYLNFMNNLEIVELCVKHKKRLIQFSTCEVYGKTVAAVLNKDPSEIQCPFNEDSSQMILGPIRAHRWIYASSKQLLERVIHAYGLQKGLNYTIIRPFNFIGPRIDYLPSEQPGNPRVFSHFMNALLYGTPMKLVDGGKYYRAYTYIDDAIECIIKIIENEGNVCNQQIFNIGSPKNELTIKELAEKMQTIFDKNFRIDTDPKPEIISVPSQEFYGIGYEDCDRRIPDVSKVKNLLGWEAKNTIDSTIFNTMKYFVDEHRNKSN